MTLASERRRGRPAKVRVADNGDLVVNVKGKTYTFIERNGHIRPRNTRQPWTEDRAYARTLVERARANGEVA